MKTFKEIKSDLLLKARNNNACQSGYEQAEQCETEQEALQIIANNFHWAWTNKTITKEDLLEFDPDLLKSAGIFVDFEGTIKTDLNKIIIISGCPTVVTYGTSSPTVEAYHTSSPTVVTYDTSSPRVEACHTSSPRVEAYGTSSPTVVAYNTSSPRVETYDTSSPRVSGFKNCIIENNSSMIVDLDNLIIHKSDKWQVK